MTLIDRIFLISALICGVGAAAAVIRLSFVVDQLWQGSKDRKLVEIARTRRPE